tara:strand:- start:5886 stop:6560 length:675 start_codon:yes stop_codon:yes gene_type:complete
MIKYNDQLSDRLLRLRNKLGFTQTELGKIIGVTHTSVNFWESGSTKPKSASLLKLAKALNTTPEFLLNGDDDVTGNQVMEASTTYDIGSSEVPLLQVDGSCGAGSNIDCEPLHTAKLIKEDNWFKKYNVKPKDAFAVYAKGDSMEMFIIDGDIVIFDKSKVTPKSGKIYLIRHPEGLKIKRLKQEITGGWIAESLNSKYSPEPIPKSMINDIKILGEFIYRQGG